MASSNSRSRRHGVLVVATSDYSLDLHMRGMLRDLARHGMGPVHIAAADSGRLTRVATREGVPAHPIPMRRDMSPWHDLVALIRLIGLYLHVRPALTIYGTPKAALLGAIAAWLTRVPARVQILHGLRLETVQGISRRILLATEWLALTLSTSTLAVSASLRQRCIELGLNGQRMRVLGPGGFVGMDLDRHRLAGGDTARIQALRTEMGATPDVPLIGFAGRVTRDKGIIELIDAVAALRATGSPIEVALVGEDEGINELPARTRTLLAQPWAHLVGAVPDATGHIAAFDVLCLPSYREGLPTVILEAMASGVPVIGSTATGVVDLVKDGDTGLLVPTRDAAALSNAIALMLDNDALRLRLTTRAQDYVTAFAEAPMWRRHRSHYEALLRLTT